MHAEAMHVAAQREDTGHVGGWLKAASEAAAQGGCVRTGRGWSCDSIARSAGVMHADALRHA